MGCAVNEEAQNTLHNLTVERLRNELPKTNLTGWQVRFQCSITLADSVPEPDVILVRDRSSTDGSHPNGAELGIILEVAERSLSLDRVQKATLHARAGIPVYWIINVVDRQLEVYTHPDPTADPPAYATRTDYKPGESVPIVLDGHQAATVPVSELIA
jgi:Uma2 family endonuclease